jgi:hypothetical protein
MKLMGVNSRQVLHDYRIGEGLSSFAFDRWRQVWLS